MRKYFTKLKNVLYKKDANKCSENIDFASAFGIK